MFTVNTVATLRAREAGHYTGTERPSLPGRDLEDRHDTPLVPIA